MYQREKVRRALAQARIFDPEDRGAQEFLKELDRRRGACWPELAQVLRKCCPKLKEPVAQAIWRTGDKLLRANLIQVLDPQQRDELRILTTLTRQARADRDVLELQNIIERDNPELLGLVAKKKGLPLELDIAIKVREPAAE